jgi:hypothetical protein
MKMSMLAANQSRYSGIDVDDVARCFGGNQWINMWIDNMETDYIPLEVHGNLIGFPMSKHLAEAIMQGMTAKERCEIMPDNNVHWLTSPLPEMLDENTLEARYFCPSLYDDWITEVCGTNILNSEDDNYIIPDNTRFCPQVNNVAAWMQDLRVSTEAHISRIERLQNADFAFHHFDRCLRTCGTRRQ